MKNNISDIKDQCSSCGACKYVCPTNAISFTLSALKQRIAVVDSVSCINCGKCVKVCPQKVQKLAQVKDCLAAWNNSGYDTSNSSSGGVIAVLSKKFIEGGGVVVGAKWDAKKRVVFEVVGTQEGLKVFQGSKYVESLIEKDVFEKIKACLQDKQPVLFIGLPCQVCAIKNIFNSDFLYCVDLVCHGTPPVEYLQEHLKKFNDKIDNITFRGKADFFLACYDKNNAIVYKESQHCDLYFKAFLEGVTYKESCYSCVFAKQERVGDITAGDFWGLDRETLQNNTYQGKVSLILKNTSKGEYLLELIKQDCIFEKRLLEEAIKENQQLSHPALKSEDRIRFEKIYPKLGFQKAVKKLTIYQGIKKLRKAIFITAILQYLRKFKD